MRPRGVQFHQHARRILKQRIEGVLAAVLSFEFEDMVVVRELQATLRARARPLLEFPREGRPARRVMNEARFDPRAHDVRRADLQHARRGLLEVFTHGCGAHVAGDGT
ncbi:hypothetical protein ACFSC4_17575 [Deinococcus malanensis]|uniref:hypothetical protein n=1 Tax=Deinococcus malanensis TaxID=1706855 RepID=UPI0036425DB7